MQQGQIELLQQQNALQDQIDQANKPLQHCKQIGIQLMWQIDSMH